VLDELRPGELTGGHKLAVTGTINIDGTVGDVGGVVQKTAAVRHAGADIFLVPPGEYEQAKAHAGTHLKVFKVRTLDEALIELGRVLVSSVSIRIGVRHVPGLRGRTGGGAAARRVGQPELAGQGAARGWLFHARHRQLPARRAGRRVGPARVFVARRRRGRRRA